MQGEQTRLTEPGIPGSPEKRANKSGSRESKRPTLSSLSSGRGVIIRGPDGKLMHGRPEFSDEKAGSNEDILEIRENAHLITNQINEEDWAEIVGSEGTASEIISKYNKAKNFLMFFLFLQLCIDAGATYLQYAHKANTLKEMAKFYALMKPKQIEFLFYMMSSLEIVFCLFYYSIGFYATWKKSIRLLDLFNLVCLLGLLSQMMQAYIQRYQSILTQVQCD